MSSRTEPLCSWRQISPSMPDSEYKHAYKATFEDAKKILKRLRKIAKPLGFTTAIYGSTVLDGSGHDIDVSVMGSNDQRVTPYELAMRILLPHAKFIHLYHQEEHGDMADVFIVMVTHDNLCVDLHIKGASDG